MKSYLNFLLFYFEIIFISIRKIKSQNNVILVNITGDFETFKNKFKNQLNDVNARGPQFELSGNTVKITFAINNIFSCAYMFADMNNVLSVSFINFSLCIKK